MHLEKMEWVELSSIKKVKYLGNNKILLEIKRGNTSPLRMRLQYATIYLLHQLHEIYPESHLIDVGQPDGMRFKLLKEGNGLRFIKMQPVGDVIWTSPFFTLEEMSGLIQFVKALPAINTSEYIALVVNG